MWFESFGCPFGIEEISAIMGSSFVMGIRGRTSLVMEKTGQSLVFTPLGSFVSPFLRQDLAIGQPLLA